MGAIKKKIDSNIVRVYKAFNKMEMRVLPGNVAFFFVLALVPIITLVISIVSKFSISVTTVTELVEQFFPSDASRIIVNTIVGRSSDSGIGLFSLVVLLIATNGTYAIINASNTLYGIKRSDVIKDRVKSLVLLIILLLLIIFILIVPVFGGHILSLIHNNKFYNNILIIYGILRWPVTFFLIYFNLKLIYTIAPSKSISSSSTTYGALFTTIIWVIVTAIFSYYLKYFADYSRIYGNLSSIIILMIWIYLISYVFVMGIAINSVTMEERSRNIEK